MTSYRKYYYTIEIQENNLSRHVYLQWKEACKIQNEHKKFTSMSWKSWNLTIAIKIALLCVFLNDLCQRNVDSGWRNWQFIAMIITVKMTLYHPLIIPLPIPTKKKKETNQTKQSKTTEKKENRQRCLGLTLLSEIESHYRVNYSIYVINILQEICFTMLSKE